MPLSRRSLLASSLALPAMVRAQGASARVVVVGGGFGGATVARYLRAWAPRVQVTLVEPALRFFTCPFSNHYLAGLRSWDSIGHGYDGLRASGVRVVHARAEQVHASARTLRLDSGQLLPWDRLVLSPGVDMRWGALEGYDEAAAELAPHAWKAGAQTRLLRRQLQAMPDGGVFVMVIPDNPFRCPPGPYERASLVAHYLRRHKPRSKILLLDAKNNFSKKELFLPAWKALYGELIEWVSLAQDGQVVRVDARALEVETAFGTRHRADVLNVIPPQKAGLIAERTQVTDASGWAPVHGENLASTRVAGIHVLGDAALAGPIPKSGFAANNQGKVVAAALAAELSGQAAPGAVYANTCYSLLAPGYGISVAGMYRAQEGRIVDVPHTVGISPLDAPAAYRAAEARHGAAWYAAISADIWDR
ncbi:MAG: FAD-dependent oxidoreductase [Proteobacteria bacterium]|nr:FAD-dependent oxidoreductase [Pseudomonadota bacterium]